MLRKVDDNLIEKLKNIDVDSGKIIIIGGSVVDDRAPLSVETTKLEDIDPAVLVQRYFKGVDNYATDEEDEWDQELKDVIVGAFESDDEAGIDYYYNKLSISSASNEDSSSDDERIQDERQPDGGSLSLGDMIGDDDSPVSLDEILGVNNDKVGGNNDEESTESAITPFLSDILAGSMEPLVTFSELLF